MTLATLSVGFLAFSSWRLRTLRSRTPITPITPSIQSLGRPDNQIPILDYGDLVQLCNAAPLLLQIERKSRFTPAHYAQCVLPLVQGFAEFVQQLPASESDHHAEPGGLFIHALECVNYALDQRAGKQLPSGFSTETTRKYEHHASYALIVAALLHDVGKPIADVRVALYPDRQDSAPDPWVGLAGTMNRGKYAFYTVDFPLGKERDYELHKKLPVLLVHGLVPVVAFNWLSECPSVVSEMFDYLAGNKTEGLLAQLVKEADRESVRQNLSKGSRTRFATAKSVPLIERLMEGLRRLLTEGHELPLNRAGAAGFVHQGEVWFYCVRVAGAVREYLQNNEIIQGKAGLPVDDQRFFDVWQSFGAVVTNPETLGAIWYARVELTSSWISQDGQTFLRFPLKNLYPDPALYPPQMNGQMVVTSKLSSASKGPAIASEPISPAVAVVAAITETNQLAALETPSTNENTSNNELSVDALFAAINGGNIASLVEPAKSASNEFLDNRDMAVTPVTDSMTLEETRPIHYPEGSDSPKEITAPMRIEQTLTPEQQALVKSSPKTERAQMMAKNFLAFLQEGIAKGSLKFNCSGAYYHFVEEGLLITTPNSFRDYCQQFSSRFLELGENWDSLAPTHLQRALIESDWAQPLVKGYSIHTYQVNGGGLLKCFLIPRLRAQLLFNPLPATNPAIERMSLVRQLELAGNSLSPKQRDSLKERIKKEGHEITK